MHNCYSNVHICIVTIARVFDILLLFSLSYLWLSSQLSLSHFIIAISFSHLNFLSLSDPTIRWVFVLSWTSWLKSSDSTTLFSDNRDINVFCKAGGGFDQPSQPQQRNGSDQPLQPSLQSTLSFGLNGFGFWLHLGFDSDQPWEWETKKAQSR